MLQCHSYDRNGAQVVELMEHRGYVVWLFNATFSFFSNPIENMFS